MELKTISYQEFLKIIKSRTIVKDATQSYSNIANFYLNLPVDKFNQTIAYEIDDVDSFTEAVISNETEEAKSAYARFGIYFKSLINVEDSSIEFLEANRQYITFLDIELINHKPIDASKSKDDEPIDLLESKFTVFNSKYLPEGATPSWYLDFTTFDDYNDVVKKRVKIRTLYPQINSMLAYTDLKKVHIRDGAIEYEIQHALEGTEGYTRYDITDVVDEIATRYFTTNIGTHELFVTKLDEIGSKITDSDYIVYYGENMEEYILCAVYLTYFHNANCHVSEYDTPRFFDCLTSLFFNESDMLVEERVQYLLNFPTYTFDVTDYTIVYKATLKSEVKGKVQLCSLNIPVSMGIDESAIKKENLVFLNNYEFNNASLLPLLDYFKLDSKNLAEAKRAEENLRKVLIKLESILNIPKDKILSYNDIFLIDTGGEIALGYLEKLDLKTYTTILAGCMTTETSVAGAADYPVSFKVDEMGKAIPLDILKENKKAIIDLMRADIRLASPEVQKKLGVSKVTRVKVKHPLKFSSKYALPLSNFYINLSNIVLSGLSEDLFYDLGKYLPDCHYFRIGGNRLLSSKLGRNSIRNSSNLISAFGGYHPLCSSALYINENNIENEE